MSRYLLLIILLLLSPGVVGQDQPKLIVEIEFFGYSDTDLIKLRAALPIHERVVFSADTFAGQAEQAGLAIKQVTGRWPTDMTTVCCDGQGNWIIFIGLAGKPIRYNPRPEGTIRLPEQVLSLYGRFIKANSEGVQKGVSREDGSRGYSLAEYPPLRSVQLEMRAYAIEHEA